MDINVTKTFLPKFEEYENYIKKIWESRILTNQGPLATELEHKLESYLNVQNVNFVTNGTIALQLAIAALDISEGEIITTPFSYVATSSSILWQRCEPVFVDIEKDNYTIDVSKIESAITPSTKAILAVHVFGYACDVETISEIAKKHGIKIIYDGAHAFGSRYNEKSLLSYGDISTCSFHATKIFQTVEGGACITNNKNLSNIIDLKRRFGHNNDLHLMLGINGKQSEFHAAMGLSLLPYIPQLIKSREKISIKYDSMLTEFVTRPKKQKSLEYNYSYYPIVLSSPEERDNVIKSLHAINVFPRRYFYPSLNTLPYLKNNTKCPISENICSRIICLPLYPELEESNVEKIAKTIVNSIKLH